MAGGPNIIFMLADNLGYGDLSCYGGSVPTPRIDTLAAEGTRFKNFNTEAQCTPTRGALLTGRMPIRTG
ncbi:MAG: sulfatase-like hydrolase/transferase, partial [Actinomycetota bacterium]|nr:sulfatase-like hydrolase/transferase [Actinomycetota bacterium]